MADFNINNLTGGLYPTFAAKSAKEIVSRVKSGENRVDEIFGTPLYMPLKLNDILLPLEPIVSVRTRKKIITTNINRSTSRGSIKELFAEGDYELTISGFLMDNTNTGFDKSYSLIAKDFPVNSFKALRDICERQEAIKIESTITEYLNIQFVVISDYSFPGNNGSPDRQAYTIRAISDQGSSTENIYSNIIKQLNTQ
ncbi:hypothetical protein MY04_4801 [Flammeovirga sp. MY04]|uniref:DUF6046 domain-containing protein n=1 Tax=Flammeovirga sp. MY04 TaxID=1191459 RepID=UPI00080643E1|nr:DUF6046 domain-containing protein [Flammeovirga sp. MY04]ANQ49618.1 hypothetical protein MY04_2244 [Flammeovirga sp. MY04]ANQ52136.1 hypothetical protein MY04_4801 [Flammeovirga sp. MY04]